MATKAHTMTPPRRPGTAHSDPRSSPTAIEMDVLDNDDEGFWHDFDGLQRTGEAARARRLRARQERDRQRRLAELERKIEWECQTALLMMGVMSVLSILWMAGWWVWWFTREE
ncbi:MAG: hypothetical protein M1832_005528 [Thelocarpon impressellum]|nr:MAG: hypothetical protein M1832_005528 [Thelocarpon impressellum]